MSTGEATTIQTMNLEDIRSVLSDEMAQLREGTSTAQRAQAVTNIAGKILSSYKLEMEYLRLSGRKVNLAVLNSGTEDVLP